MPIQIITYKSIINEVKNWIKSNCINITNYGSIKPEFKAGWSRTDATMFVDNDPALGVKNTCKISISRSIPSATASNVDSDIDEFCKTYNIQPDATITEDELYHFIQNMISFICTKCCYATSQYSQENSYLVYIPSNKSYMNVFTIDGVKTPHLITSIDTKSIMTTMFDVVNRNLRSYHCQYTYTFG